MWCHKGNREDECEEIDLKDPVLWQSMMGEATKWHQAKSESWISKRNKVTYDVRETITYHAGYLCARCCLIKMRGGQENMSSEAGKKSKKENTYTSYSQVHLEKREYEVYIQKRIWNPTSPWANPLAFK